MLNMANIIILNNNNNNNNHLNNAYSIDMAITVTVFRLLMLDMDTFVLYFIQYLLTCTYFSLSVFISVFNFFLHPSYVTAVVAAELFTHKRRWSCDDKPTGHCS